MEIDSQRFNSVKNKEKILFLSLTITISFSCILNHYAANNGLKFYPECGESLAFESSLNPNDTLADIYKDPRREWDFVRTPDAYVGSSSPSVYDPMDIIIKYLSDPSNSRTYLYIDRKYRNTYTMNVSWVCHWEDTYSDNDLTYYLLSFHSLHFSNLFLLFLRVLTVLTHHDKITIYVFIQSSTKGRRRLLHRRYRI